MVVRIAKWIESSGNATFVEFPRILFPFEVQPVVVIDDVCQIKQLVDHRMLHALKTRFLVRRHIDHVIAGEEVLPARRMKDESDSRVPLQRNDDVAVVMVVLIRAAVIVQHDRLHAGTIAQAVGKIPGFVRPTRVDQTKWEPIDLKSTRVSCAQDSEDG